MERYDVDENAQQSPSVYSQNTRQKRRKCVIQNRLLIQACANLIVD